ncbi:MAG: hypothetical protein ABGW69_02855 [Nanoarchaeota archaeon]
MSFLTEEEIVKLVHTLGLSKTDIADIYKTGHFFLNPNTFKQKVKEVFTNIVNTVWKSEGDLWVVNAGGEGSGKSLFSIWLAREVSKELNIPFDIINNVSLDHDEWVLHQGALKKQFEIYDEAYETFDYQKFNTLEGQLGKEFAIRKRMLGIIQILNYPNFRTIHPYIREHRINMLILNLKVNVGNRDVFVKAFFDRQNTIQIMEEASRKNLDRIDLIKKRGKWKFFLAGVFDLSKELKEDKDFINDLKIYRLKKIMAGEKVDVFSALKSFLSKGKTYSLTQYNGNYAYTIFLLMRFLYDFTKLVLRLSNWNCTIKNTCFDISKSKNKKDPFDDVNYTNIYVPKPFIDLFMPDFIFENIFDKIIESFVYKRVEYTVIPCYKFKTTNLTKLAALTKTPLSFKKEWVKNYDLYLIELNKQKEELERLNNILENKNKLIEIVKKKYDLVKEFEEKESFEPFKKYIKSKIIQQF